MFGPHMMLDCYGCNREKLQDMKLLYKVLDELPDFIGMQKITPPYIFHYAGGEKPEDCGFSGVVIIAESHISLHSFPEKGFVTFDIYSCKDFDTERASEYLINVVEAERYEKHMLLRGREFPKDIQKATKIVARQRKRI
ncbi:MAG: adenosylmethionine decarboxylase [Candidatus Micrarchaeota archaeon]